MVLLATVPGALTQKFGPSHLAVEPAMYSTGDKAYWLPYFGAQFFDDFHPGIDRSAAVGQPVRAMEAGTVTFAGWKDSISGYMVEVEIRENTRYSSNHHSKVLCRVGDKVIRGQTLALAGATGVAFGSHTHEGVSIREKDRDGVYRTFLYNPALFMAGGKFANDPRIQPLPAPRRKLAVNGPGINIRWAPPDLDSRSNIFAVSRADGIYRVGTGRRLSGLGYAFTFLNWKEDEGLTFAVVSGYGGKRLAIAKHLTHWVEV